MTMMGHGAVAPEQVAERQRDQHRDGEADDHVPERSREGLRERA
jgi:hypothetical protein